MSRVNYGPLIEQSPLKETPEYIKERSDYDAIDYLIMEYIMVLFNINKKHMIIKLSGNIAWVTD